MNKLFVAIVFLLLLSACGSSKYVRSNRLIQKRKYTKGCHFNLKKTHKSERAGINVPESLDEMNLTTIKPTTLRVVDEHTEASIIYSQPPLKIVSGKKAIKEPVLDDNEVTSNSRSHEVKQVSSISESQKAIYPRFGVNDAETTLWIGVICLVLGFIALATMGAVPYLALSIILLLVGVVLSLIGFVNLIVGFFRSIF